MNMSPIAFVASAGPIRYTATSFINSQSSRFAIPNNYRVSKWRMDASADSSKPGSSVSPSSAQSSPVDDFEPSYSIDTDDLMDRAKNFFTDVSDRPLYYSKIFGYGVGGIVLITILRAIVSAIDSLPVLPATLELIGLGYSAWFVWRYVLFRESRMELVEEIDDFLGRTRPGGKSDEQS